jgi:hypothetical protein
MSRSKKKTKIRGTTSSPSEKEEKQFANRKFRRKNKAKTKEVDEDNYPKLREVSDVWAFSKDSKLYDKEITEKDMRK